MQIKTLDIESYRHLENINFDFTYPNGHANAGKPLEKICLIGQSATGKTTILELIKDTFLKIETTEVLNGAHLFHHFRLNFKGKIEFLYKNESLIIKESEIVHNGKEYKNIESGGGSVGKLINDSLRLLYFTSDIISKETIEFFNQNPINLNNSTDESSPWPNRNINQPNYIYEFKQEINKEIWFSLLSKILDYRKRFTQMASELINKGAIGDLNKLNKQYAKWAADNENPLIKFANYFDPILKKLNLEIDLVNTEYPIPIRSKINDDVIPISSLSTGTKGLLLSMFPLFTLDTTDSIILIDEPERSLFPDMQIDLIKHYKNIAPYSQLIIATHSPFIAAAFEPEERFILNFDRNGKVEVRPGISPIGDDPNDLLMNDFNVDYYNEFGKKAYQDYLELKRKVANEPEVEKKKELIIELAELGDKYNF
ncbi:MAG: hypothetical protein JWP81_505 [Ferruginibacter sp.]|nr:hypothetical protein [Ferruginibacter sp.]